MDNAPYKLIGTVSARETIAGTLSAGTISGIPPDYLCATDEDIEKLFDTEEKDDG